MKKIFILMMGLLFTASAVFASPNAKVEFDTMSKADTQMLFGSDSVSAVALSSDEMVATEGEWFWVIPAFHWGYRGYRVYKRYGSSAYKWSLGAYGSNFHDWR